MLRVNEDWFNDYKSDRKKKPRTQRVKAGANSFLSLMKAVKASPHQAALDDLSKHPEKLKGKQEHYRQVRFFLLIEPFEDIYSRAYTVPNGGMRGKKTAIEMTAEGLKKGQPDVSIDAARGIYHGMRIEFKHGKNKPSEDQIQCLNTRSDDGYYCIVSYDENEALSDVLSYWGLSAGQSLPPHKNDHLWRGKHVINQ
ncbi:MAG: VRR-NUC domain-containing protein [Plesiomonas sp.]|uniref:VRR-NUC domain-containing protein n=1 Tax=Plesiomonas sp. TaxID=2486279 RepID=UPI003F3132BD